MQALFNFDLDDKYDRLFILLFRSFLLTFFCVCWRGLAQVPDMGALTSYERSRIAEALDETVYLPGAVICKQGDPGDMFFIIKSGSVKVVKLAADGKTVEAEVTLNAGDYFGELALRRSEPRAATVTAVGAVVCLCMDRHSFNVCSAQFMSSCASRQFV